jgi:hypothetical protein
LEHALKRLPELMRAGAKAQAAGAAGKELLTYADVC